MGKNISKTFVILSATFMLAALGACSKKSESTTTTTSTIAITKSAFLKKGNAICAKMNAAIATLGEPTDSSTEAFAVFVHKNIDITRGAFDDIKALPVPEGEEDELQALFEKIDATLSDADAVHEAAEANEPTETINAKIQTASTSAETANNASKAYGLTECGKEA